MKITKEELKRYANGESTEAERQRIERWLEEQESALPEAPAESAQLQMIWERLSISKAEPTALPQKRNIISIKVLTKLVASVLLVVGLSWLLYSNYNSAPTANAENFLTVRTTAGQTQKVTLPDGTIVTLNAVSELVYPEHFAGNQRLVKLRGEAYFDVAHDKSKPFIVHTDSSRTQVLGTQFDLKAYPEDEQTRLTVKTGKVKFSRHDEKDPLILVAGMQGSIAFNQAAQSQQVEVADMMDWTSNSLHLKDEQLGDVAKRVERIYGIKMRFSSDDLRTITVTATFHDADIALVMKSLAFSTGLQFSRKDNIITISK